MSIIAKITSVFLGDHFKKFTDEKVASGSFNSASEVIQAGLRLLDLEELKIKRLRHEIEIGQKSGKVSNFDPEDNLARLHKKYDPEDNLARLHKKYLE